MTKTDIIVLIFGSFMFYIFFSISLESLHLKDNFKKNLKNLKEYYKENIK